MSASKFIYFKLNNPIWIRAASHTQDGCITSTTDIGHAPLAWGSAQIGPDWRLAIWKQQQGNIIHDRLNRLLPQWLTWRSSKSKQWLFLSPKCLQLEEVRKRAPGSALQLSRALQRVAWTERKSSLVPAPKHLPYRYMDPHPNSSVLAGRVQNLSSNHKITASIRSRMVLWALALALFRLSQHWKNNDQIDVFSTGSLKFERFMKSSLPARHSDGRTPYGSNIYKTNDPNSTLRSDVSRIVSTFSIAALVCLHRPFVTDGDLPGDAALGFLPVRRWCRRVHAHPKELKVQSKLKFNIDTEPGRLDTALFVARLIFSLTRSRPTSPPPISDVKRFLKTTSLTLAQTAGFIVRDIVSFGTLLPGDGIAATALAMGPSSMLCPFIYAQALPAIREAYRSEGTQYDNEDKSLLLTGNQLEWLVWLSGTSAIIAQQALSTRFACLVHSDTSTILDSVLPPHGLVRPTWDAEVANPTYYARAILGIRETHVGEKAGTSASTD
ncbi:hypothetical protein BU15DRAFT_68267 [Melanogaster broomeanus]|nr:hypothetical protein BU15DRAFT_68267 [Melanogaster broomeanus]